MRRLSLTPNEPKDKRVGGHNTRAFDVHEVRVWGLHKSLEFVSFVFGFLGRVKKIDSGRLSRDR